MAENKYTKEGLEKAKAKAKASDIFARDFKKDRKGEYHSRKYNRIRTADQEALEKYQTGFDASEKYKTADESTVSGRLRKEAGANVADDKQMMDILKGATVGESILGEEGLGRISEEQNEAMRGMKTNAAELAKGYNSQQMLAMKEKGMEGIQGATSAQSRAMQAALARSGVKGQAAGQQLGNIALGGIKARGNLERDLQIKQFDAQLRGSQFQQGIERDATANNQFDLGQAAKEKKMVLASAFGYSALGASERGAELNAEAIKAAGQQGGGGGGGTTFVCSALRRSGRMSPYETAVMLKIMLSGVIRYTKFLSWYFREAPELAKEIENTATNIEMNAIKKNTVTDVMTILEKEGIHQGSQKYIKEVCKIAESYGYPVGKGLEKSSWFNTIVYLPSLFTLGSTWKWMFDFAKLKMTIKLKRLIKA